jgi:hypothetical protein
LGNIERLLIRVPWSKLSSEPVEIELIGLYIILTPLNAEEWEFDDETDLSLKNEKIAVHE